MCLDDERQAGVDGKGGMDIEARADEIALAALTKWIGIPNDYREHCDDVEIKLIWKEVKERLAAGGLGFCSVK